MSTRWDILFRTARDEYRSAWGAYGRVFTLQAKDRVVDKLVRVKLIRLLCLLSSTGVSMAPRRASVTPASDGGLTQ